MFFQIIVALTLISTPENIKVNTKTPTTSISINEEIQGKIMECQIKTKQKCALSYKYQGGKSVIFYVDTVSNLVILKEMETSESLR